MEDPFALDRNALLSQPLCAEPDRVPPLPLREALARHLIGPRTYRVLTDHGYATIREVAFQTPQALMRIRNFGQHSLRGVKAALIAIVGHSEESSTPDMN
jgi:hypothetical protein